MKYKLKYLNIYLSFDSKKNMDFLFFILWIYSSCISSEKIKKLNLPIWSLGYQDISNTTEISPKEIKKAYNTFSYPLNPNSNIIISSRFSNLEEQFNHFIFGTALAYALNRSIKLEMRHYPLSDSQPEFHFQFQNLDEPKLYDADSFKRLRVARELFCKNESYFQTDSPSIPILVRNYDDISSLYGNHFIGSRLRSLFGIHAAYFLSHHFIKLDTTKVVKSDSDVIGIDARLFSSVHRMKTLKNAKTIISNFTSFLKQIDPEKKCKIVIVSNSDEVLNGLQKKLWNVEKSTDDINGFVKLVGSKIFVGTYRSKFSQSVNMMRGVSGFLVNTNTGDVINMSSSQTGVLQPYFQDVEDAEFTVNEKLRGCTDNIEDLRVVLDNFVL